MNKNIVLGGIVAALFVAGAIFAFSSGPGKVAAVESNSGAKISGCTCQGGGANCGPTCGCGCQNKVKTATQGGCGCRK